MTRIEEERIDEMRPVFTAPYPPHWNSDEGTNMANDYVGRTRDQLAKSQLSDFELANGVYMVGRDSLELMSYQTAAKERIRWLSAQLARADLELKELRAQGGVTVRPLEWTAIMAPRSNEDPSMEETGDFDAETPFGAYTIDMGFGSDEYTWSLYFEGVSVDGVRGADDPEKLKDAAFADYRTRILSALETEAVEPVAWREVVKDIRDRCSRRPALSGARTKDEILSRALSNSADLAHIMDQCNALLKNRTATLTSESKP